MIASFELSEVLLLRENTYPRATRPLTQHRYSPPVCSLLCPSCSLRLLHQQGSFSFKVCCFLSSCFGCVMWLSLLGRLNSLLKARLIVNRSICGWCHFVCSHYAVRPVFNSEWQVQVDLLFRKIMHCRLFMDLIDYQSIHVCTHLFWCLEPWRCAWYCSMELRTTLQTLQE